MLQEFKQHHTTHDGYLCNASVVGELYSLTARNVKALVVHYIIQCSTCVYIKFKFAEKYSIEGCVTQLQTWLEKVQIWVDHAQLHVVLRHCEL